MTDHLIHRPLTIRPTCLAWAIQGLSFYLTVLEVRDAAGFEY